MLCSVTRTLNVLDSTTSTTVFEISSHAAHDDECTSDATGELLVGRGTLDSMMARRRLFFLVMAYCSNFI